MTDHIFTTLGILMWHIDGVTIDVQYIHVIIMYS